MVQLVEIFKYSIVYAMIFIHNATNFMNLAFHATCGTSNTQHMVQGLEVN